MDIIARAFEQMQRQNFVPEEQRVNVNVNAPIPIGYGQTNSQPYTVEKMLRWLEPEPGNKVLDVGSGSGWTTALLAYLVGRNGKVYAVEKIPELVEFGRDNCNRLGIKNAQFFEAGKGYGLPEYAPYDRILVSASATKMPQELIDQLKPGGKLVIPVKSDILEVEKITDNSLDIKAHPGFIFVPLV